MRKFPSLLLLLLLHEFLGASYVGAQSKVVGGGPAATGDYPWMVALIRPGTGALRTRQFCGGSLIHPSWVLTAAHCVENLSEADLQAVINITDLNNAGASITRNIAGIYIHPGYERVEGDLLNDMALLLLASPVNTVTPVAYSVNAGAAPPRTPVRAIGWGDTRGNPRFPTQLQVVDLIIENLKNTQFPYGGGRLDIRHLAAISPGKDTCQGDSGGPLFLPTGAVGKPLVVGVTSYGIGCAVPDIAGLYANVGYFGPWVNYLLSQPTVLAPDLTLYGNGLEIANGSPTASILDGTVFKGYRRVRPGRSATGAFVIKNEAGRIPLSVKAIISDLNDFTLLSGPSYVMENSSVSFLIRYRAPYARRKGISDATITIRTNDPGDPIYNFPVKSRYKKAR